jgi:predicted neutral ceramidase superfamily lipid hydrolase
MTEEELQEMAAKMQAQGQGQAPDPAMVLAQAEQMKAQADMMKTQIDAQKVQNETLKIQLQAQNDQNELVAEQAKTQVDVFNAQTNRIKAQVEAEKAGAVIDHTNIKAFGDQLDNQEKMSEMMDEQERRARDEHRGLVWIHAAEPFAG